MENLTQVEEIEKNMQTFVRTYVAERSDDQDPLEVRTGLALLAIVKICARLEYMILDEPTPPAPTAKIVESI